MDNVKYTVSFKDPDGGHNSTRTLDTDEYIHLLHTTIAALKGEIKENPYPTVNFITERRTQIYETKE